MGIRVNRRASAAFGGLVPQIGGERRGGSKIPAAGQIARCRDFLGKRLKGFEPSTFCMASRRSSQLSYSRTRAILSRRPAPVAGGASMGNYHRRMSCRRTLALCLAAVAIPAIFPGAAVPQLPTHDERWVTLDRVRGVGHIDWTCRAGDARIRFVNGGLTSARVRAFTGAELRFEAIMHPRVATEMPFGQRVQRWRVRQLSESLPEPVNFRVRTTGPPCARPVALHDFG
jgi:hypothetical protein